MRHGRIDKIRCRGLRRQFYSVAPPLGHDGPAPATTAFPGGHLERDTLVGCPTAGNCSIASAASTTKSNTSQPHQLASMAAARMAVRPAHTATSPGSEVIAAGFAEGYFDVTFARRPRQSTIDCHDPERPLIGDLRGGIDRQVLAELRQTRPVATELGRTAGARRVEAGNNGQALRAFRARAAQACRRSSCYVLVYRYGAGAKENAATH
jgi:hypothetical protein